MKPSGKQRSKASLRNPRDDAEPTISKALTSPDILTEIISHVCACPDSPKRHCVHVKILFNCIQVSRAWADVIIPRLWARYGKLEHFFPLMFEKEFSIYSRYVSLYLRDPLVSLISLL
jgi:hypothetical protein